jgi:hypothetical protein
MLTSPLFKNSWLDSPFKPVAPDIEITLARDDQLHTLYRKDSDANCLALDNAQRDARPFKAVLNTNIPELLSENSSREDRSGDILKPLSPLNLSSNQNGSKHFDFDLEKDVRQMLLTSSDYSEPEKRRLLGVINSKNKNAIAFNKTESLRRYLEKKKRRKHVCQIKYKIRQDLACKRLRVKGKFVKSSKMDLITAANMLLVSELIRGDRRGADQGGFRVTAVLKPFLCLDI